MSSKESVTICEHMNKDHRASLFDYAALATGAKWDINDPKNSVSLIDVTRSGFTLLVSRGGDSRSLEVPFEPALETFAEARVRFISLAFKAADYVKHSPYRITEFVAPQSPKQRALFKATLTLLAVCVFGFLKGLSSPQSGFWLKFYRLCKVIVPGAFAVHAVEYFVVVRSLLKFHRVPNSLRKKYFWTTLLGGFTAWLPLQAKSADLADRRRSYEAKLDL